MKYLYVSALTLLILVLGYFVYITFFTTQKPVNQLSNNLQKPPVNQINKIFNQENQPKVGTKLSVRSVAPTLTPTKAPDNPNTLSSPKKITTKDGKQYMYYGEPAGQNNKKKKKIIFSLPGHGSTAEQDYVAWKEQLLVNGTYALASINWWDGKDEKIEDYFQPPKIVEEINYFLKNQGYKNEDIIVLEGFSRGSANTYSVVANDVFTKSPVIDAVISASGKYQSDFAMTKELLGQNNGKPFMNIPWILACGEKDDNPTRDGCIGMKETRTFLQEKGANVLDLLSDPNGAHGAFHQSPLKLATKALSLLDSHFSQ